MTVLEAALLGAIQGATEFLPVSSSAHLFLAQHLLGLRQPELAFDLLLHLGTLAAVVVFLRGELFQILRSLFRSEPDPWSAPSDWGRRDLWLGILASIPTAAIGFAFHDIVETGITLRGIGLRYLVLTTLLLLTLARFRYKDEPDRIEWWEALLIGTVQGLAVFPGLSRSGSTIILALLLGIGPMKAAKFSFLLSIPAILGGTVFTMLKGVSGLHGAAVSTAGFLVAMATGYAALILVEGLVVRGRFHRFAPYTLALSGLCFYLYYVS
ncbi:MAG: undecaprenyl-diphosphate phosphatase [Thermodesulfobacteriota bacterium]